MTRCRLHVEALRSALGLGKINLLNSYGGVVSQAYALRFPDSLGRLILVDTLFSSEMWQANYENSLNELENQFPEIWQNIQKIRNPGFNMQQRIARCQRCPPV